MRTIGFAGTAKNTGKTTTASAVLQAAHGAGRIVALTSIGYDGEAVDTVTGLPKPRYFLPAGVLVATTDRCLAAGSAGCEILAGTGITTILGEIRLARVTQPGLVLLAGPNRRADLERVLAALAASGAALTLVDGALNRLVPLSAAGGLVLSTGAALHVAPCQVAAHAAGLVQIFSLPVVGRSAETESIRWTALDGRSGSAAAGSLIGAESCQAVSERLPAAVQQLTIPGACDPAWLERLLDG
ncbi:MAG TPA: hypothetical protein VFF68_09840, partial [Anaerolineaceae bacterium]|nr:hypothetical protein [Anaerolineaceae bacterium]